MGAREVDLNYLSLIHERISTRSYTDQVPGEDVLEALIDYAQGLQGPFGHRARFAWVGFAEKDAAGAKTLGTYGMIRGAKTYLVGALKRGPGAAEDYGYLFEKVLLKATALGLGTCWLGGTFDRSTFSSRVDLADGEFIPAISPVGFASTKERIKDALVITALGARGRKPLKDLVWGDWGAWKDGLEAVRLGPSASNKQPWRMAADPDGSRVHFYLEPTAGYNDVSVGRVGFPIQTLDLGIAWCHFELALADHGVTGRWTKADPGLGVPAKWEYSATWMRMGG